MSEVDAQEAAARRLYIAMNAVRIAGIAVLLMGLMIARGLIGLPWWLGAVLAVGGLIAFFFVPTLMVRRWKQAEQQRGNGR